MNTYVNYLYLYVVNQQIDSKNSLYQKLSNSPIILGEIAAYISNNLAVPIAVPVHKYYFKYYQYNCFY